MAEFGGGKKSDREFVALTAQEWLTASTTRFHEVPSKKYEGETRAMIAFEVFDTDGSSAEKTWWGPGRLYPLDKPKISALWDVAKLLLGRDLDPKADVKPGTNQFDEQLLMKIHCEVMLEEPRTDDQGREQQDVIMIRLPKKGATKPAPTATPAAPSDPTPSVVACEMDGCLNLVKPARAMVSKRKHDGVVLCVECGKEAGEAL